MGVAVEEVSFRAWTGSIEAAEGRSMAGRVRSAQGRPHVTF
jgi:hypothetical protein